MELGGHSADGGNAVAGLAPRRWAAGVAYEGSAFDGWQIQPMQAGVHRSIQGQVEQALARVAGERMPTRCAGRTDAGVHAVNQIMHFETTVDRPESAWVRGTRRFLPAGIALRWARPVPADFDARLSARSRTYCYLVQEGRESSPLWRLRAGHSLRPLDLERLRLASQPLLGCHDFSAFRSSQCQARTPIRTMERLEWTRQGSFLLCRLTANAFLHHMVRNLVATLLMAGDGRRAIDWPAAVLASRDRSLAAATFSPAGLYLVAVRYDPRFGLPGLPADDQPITLDQLG